MLASYVATGSAAVRNKALWIGAAGPTGAESAGPLVLELLNLPAHVGARAAFFGSPASLSVPKWLVMELSPQEG